MRMLVSQCKVSKCSIYVSDEAGGPAVGRHSSVTRLDNVRKPVAY